METVAFQSFVFSYTVYGGIMIGILYDIYRVLRGIKRREHLISSVWDAIFLTAVLFVVIWAIFSSNYGDLRAYIFLGFAVGFLLYEKILSRIIVAIFTFAKRNILFFFKTTNSLFILPFKLLYNLLWYPISRFFSFLDRKRLALKKIKKIPKILLNDSKKYYKLIIKGKIKKAQ